MNYSNFSFTIPILTIFDERIDPYTFLTFHQEKLYVFEFRLSNVPKNFKNRCYQFIGYVTLCTWIRTILNLKNLFFFKFRNRQIFFKNSKLIHQNLLSPNLVENLSPIEKLGSSLNCCHFGEMIGVHLLNL